MRVISPSARDIEFKKKKLKKKKKIGKREISEAALLQLIKCLRAALAGLISPNTGPKWPCLALLAPFTRSG